MSQAIATKDIFISHAAKDKKLTDIFVDFLQTGLSIPDTQIFCTSLEGLGIPPGLDFIEFIHSNMHSAKVVIALLTPNYFNSQFCLCELGACWALQKNFIPLVVPPITFNDLNGVITTTQGLMIDNPPNLTTMATTITDWLKVKYNPTRFEVKRDNFLKQFGAINITTNILSVARLEELEKSCAKYQKDAREYFEENEKLTAKIADLEKCKDREEVEAVQVKHSDEFDQFDTLVDNVKKTFTKLRNATIEAYYLKRRYPHRYFNPDYCVDSAINEGELILHEGEGLTLNEEDPNVQNMQKAICKLDSFLEKCSEEFDTWFVKKYNNKNLDHTPFWQQAFDVHIGV